MRKNICLTFVALLITNMICFGQDFIKRLNNLPPTIAIKAPKFDVEIKYSFSIDSVNNLLIIQDFRRNPENNEAHFHQPIYEFPLDDLIRESFKVAKNAGEQETLNIILGTKENKSSIIKYFLSDDQVVLIQSQDILELGPWTYSKEMELELNEILKLIIDKIPDKGYKTDLLGMRKSFYKFHTDIVTIKGGSLDEDKSLSNGYYYGAGLKLPPLYADTKDVTSSNSKIIKDISVAIKNKNISTASKIPVFIYINSSGQIESIQVFDQQSTQTKSLDLSNFKAFTRAQDDDIYVKSKLLLIIK